MTKDYYYILGVDADCTTDEVREAYRKLSKKFHPDLNQNDSYFEGRFKEIQEAYETLSNPATRRHYDDDFFSSKNHSFTTEPTKKRKYPRTTVIDIVFSVILIGITVLFARYVISAMSATPKAVKVNNPPAVIDTAQVVATPVKHHKKKKHSFIAVNTGKPAPLPVKKPAVVAVSRPVSNNIIAKASFQIPVKLKADTPKPQPVAVLNKPVLPVRTVSNTVDNYIPYSSYLRANLTGVINMHRSENIGSDILAVIPTHSKVLVLQKGDAYYKVQFNGDEGYVPRWTVLTK